MDKTNELYFLVKERLSEARFKHTEGVLKAAQELGKKLLPDKICALSYAALLHDIAKEIDTEDQIRLSKEYGYVPTSSDLESASVLHSFAAPAIIKRDFPHFASDEIISAVFNHTVGAPDMSLFDEIIFVSDFIEENRRYDSCIEVRNRLLKTIVNANSDREVELALHEATVASIDATISSLISKMKPINKKTIITRNAFLKKVKNERKN